MNKVKPHKMTRYGSEPVCPRCGYKGYDDWWHVLKTHKHKQPTGKLACGSCEKTFFVSGVPGSVFSTAFGLDETDRALRSVGL